MNKQYHETNWLMKNILIVTYSLSIFWKGIGSWLIKVTIEGYKCTGRSEYEYSDKNVLVEGVIPIYFSIILMMH